MSALADPLVLITLFVVVLAAAVIQGTMGFGLGLIAVPFLGLLLPHRMPQLLLLISLPLLAGVFVRERRQLDAQSVPWLLGGRLAGVLPGVVLVRWLDPGGLRITLGILTLGAVALISQRRIRLPRSPAGLVATGLASGLMATTAGLGGPPLVLLYADDALARLRATVAAVFLVGNAVALASFAAVGRLGVEDALLAAVLLPAVGIGLWGSSRLIDRVRGPVARRAVLSMIAAAAMVVIARGLGVGSA